MGMAEYQKSERNGERCRYYLKLFRKVSQILRANISEYYAKKGIGNHHPYAVKEYEEDYLLHIPSYYARVKARHRLVFARLQDMQEPYHEDGCQSQVIYHLTFLTFGTEKIRYRINNPFSYHHDRNRGQKEARYLREGLGARLSQEIRYFGRI